jgi:hypothetical protein
MAKRSSTSKEKKGGKRRGRPSKYDDVTTGKIIDRRYGLRIDDDIEVYIIAGDTLKVVKGRVLDHKKDLHLEDEDGYYHRISFDWVADIILLKHNRPHPTEDPEYKRKKEPSVKNPVRKLPPQDHAYL